jgi:uncharacterized membrane protein YphA (DoxX/SURF4 family)
MNVGTRVFLVLLRFAIGWHFLIEGLEKLDSHYHWFHRPPEGQQPWSSAAYLKGSTGPMAGLFRGQLGDPDLAALERLTVPQLDKNAPKWGAPRRALLDVLIEQAIAGKSLLQGKPGETLPPALEKDWQEYFDRFVKQFHVGDENWKPEAGDKDQKGKGKKRDGEKQKWGPSGVVRLLAVNPRGGFPAAVPWPTLILGYPQERPDKVQAALARVTFEHAKEEALLWLAHGKRQVERTFSLVTEKVSETTAERIQVYAKKLREVRDIEEHGQPAFGSDVWKKKLVTLKDQVNRARTELLDDLYRPLREATEFTYKVRLTPEQRDLGTLPPAPTGAPDVRERLWWIDQITMWGLTAVGVCLLLGLFTRTACVGGAAFLLMFYLAMPSLPWLPANPRAEGHYLLVNKNIIEMLALLALATTHSGRWAGLDGLIHFFSPFRLRKRPQPGNKNEWDDRPERRTPARPPERAVPAPPAPPSPVKESKHGP